MLMTHALSRGFPWLSLAWMLLMLPRPATAQQSIWTDTFNGGVVVGTFSIGDQNSGMGMIENALPPGATIRHATLYALAIATNPGDAVSFTMGTLTINFGPSTAGPSFGSLYGPVVLHALDVTNVLNPATAMYTINLTGMTTNFKEFVLVTEYELPGMGPISVDVFHLGLDSQLEETYAITASHPMSTATPIALGTMGAYCRSWLSDYESVNVNGTVLGNFFGRDYNAGPGNYYGAAATFHYANGNFEGVGDDDPNAAISGTDVLSDLAGLVPHGTQSFQVTYRHNPTLDPSQQQDNIVHMIVLAYSATPCAITTGRLGADTTLCPGDTLVLDATLDGIATLWQNGSTASTYTVTTPGRYSVQWSGPECTYNPDTVVIDMVQLPDIELGPDVSLCIGDSVLIGANPISGATYGWGDGSTGLPRTVDASGTYLLSVSMEGCTTNDSVRVAVTDCDYNLEMPNVFTPNGDGMNDLFRPISMAGMASLSLTIHDRWGSLVFHSTDLNWSWDGRSPSGKPLAEGVYFWTMELVPKNARDVSADTHGTVMLLR